MRRLAAVALVVGAFLLVPSVEGFGLSAGQESRSAGSLAHQLDEMATTEALGLSERP